MTAAAHDVWPAETREFHPLSSVQKVRVKSARRGWSRRRNHRGPAITDPARLDRRRRDLVQGGPWTGSPEAKDAHDLLCAIIAVQIENTATRDDPVLSRVQLTGLLRAEPGPGRNDAALNTLLNDWLLTLTQSGGCAVLEVPPDPSADPYPGWQGPDPASLPKRRKLPHLKTAGQRALLLRLYRQLQADGLPEGLHLSPGGEQDYAKARKHGAVALPAWAWAWLVNRNLPEGRHPVSRWTASRRLAELDAAGQLVRVKRARVRFDPQGWAFRCRPAWWALPGPSVRAERRRKRRKSLVPDLVGGVARSVAWRLQQARWQFRDQQAWQERWAQA